MVINILQGRLTVRRRRRGSGLSYTPDRGGGGGVKKLNDPYQILVCEVFLNIFQPI